MHDVVRLAQHVCVSIPSDCMPSSSADHRRDATAKLLQAVVGEYLYMRTEAAASQYSEAVFQQLKRPCWPILCQATGALITSSGLEGGDMSHNAPAHLGNLPSYYGQVPREQTQQWRNMTSALGILQQVAGCIEHKRQAQVYNIFCIDIPQDFILTYLRFRSCLSPAVNAYHALLAVTSDLLLMTRHVTRLCQLACSRSCMHASSLQAP